MNPVTSKAIIAASKSSGAYTIVGASDWPMFLFMFGVLCALLAALIGVVLFTGKNITSDLRQCLNKLSEKVDNHINDKECHGR
jgi:hypothetical protein